MIEDWRSRGDSVRDGAGDCLVALLMRNLSMDEWDQVGVGPVRKVMITHLREC